jgi:hypothetical protein
MNGTVLSSERHLKESRTRDQFYRIWFGRKVAISGKTISMTMARRVAIKKGQMPRKIMVKGTSGAAPSNTNSQKKREWERGLLPEKLASWLPSLNFTALP